MTRCRLSLVTLNIAFLCGFILLVIPETRNAVLSQSCPGLSGTTVSSWPKNASVNVVIDPEFSAAEKAVIIDQLGFVARN
jgi:hypothetical protein